MIREDLSNKLIHLTKGDSIDEAFTNFITILQQARLVAGDGMIKGRHKCVCFTETPISKLGIVLNNREVHRMKYRPFGIMVSKEWIFSKGGRPVIYQPDEDYGVLHPTHAYRHVRYDPPQGVDFTWEREWRLRVDYLDLPEDQVTVIFPQRRWADTLKGVHNEEVVNAVNTAIQQKKDPSSEIKPYKWHYVVLEDLGLPIPDDME